MFSDSQKNKKATEYSSSQNIVAQGTTLMGDLNSEGDFRIDGNVEGTIKTKGKVVLGKTGRITGTLEAVDAYFEGLFSGKLLLSGTLTLKSSAKVEGEVLVKKLAVDPGASFNVSCTMKAAANELSNGGTKTKQSA
ncbi:MAG: polymer-forming cytoskeletal protein [Flavobacteriaceae bacterium]